MLWGCFLVAAGFLAASFDRGLEMSDEGAYLLVAADPWVAPSHGSFYGFALHPLWNLSGGFLMGFRWAGLLTWCLACFYFAHGLQRALGRMNPPSVSGIPFSWVSGSILVAGMALYSDGIRTPNYNSLVHFGAALLTGAWLHVVGAAKEPPSPSHVFMGITGVLAMLAGRWGSGLVVLLLLAWATFRVPAFRMSRPWFAWTLGGGLLAISAAIFLYVGVEALMAGFWSAKLIFAQTESHGLWLLGQYLANFFYYLYRLARAAIWILPLAAICLVLARVPSLRPIFRSKTVIFVSIAAVILALLRGYWKGGTENFSKESVLVGVWLASIVMIAGRKGLPDPAGAVRFWWMVVFMAALPWVLGLATDTSLADYAGHGALFSVAAGWFFLARWSKDQRVLATIGTLLFALGLLQAARATSSTLFSFRIGNLWMQTQEVHLGPEQNRLKLDPGTAGLVSELGVAMKKEGFRQGDPVIALTDMAGLVHLLGGQSPGVPWYFGMSPRLAGPQGEFTQYVLATLPVATLESSWVLVRGKTSIPKDLRRLWPMDKGVLPLNSGLEFSWENPAYPNDSVHLYVPAKKALQPKDPA
jgi:hypothetical protein